MCINFIVVFSHICQCIHKDRKIHMYLFSHILPVIDHALLLHVALPPLRPDYVFYCIKCMLFNNRSSARPSPHDTSHQSFLCSCIAETDADGVSHFLAHLELYNFTLHVGFRSINERNGWSHLGFTSDVFDLV